MVILPMWACGIRFRTRARYVFDYMTNEVKTHDSEGKLLDSMDMTDKFL